MSTASYTRGGSPRGRATHEDADCPALEVGELWGENRVPRHCGWGWYWGGGRLLAGAALRDCDLGHQIRTIGTPFIRFSKKFNVIYK